jgi:Ca-activated chloride channel family protein
VLRYSLSPDAAIEAGLLSHYDERGGFMSLMVEPPKVPVEDSAMMKREIVFVLDTSGSMSGAPMDTSKVFMTEALRGLRETDYFRILRFSDNSSQFSELPVLATPRNIGQGLKFVNQLYAGGGTQIDQAINTAFDMPQISDTLRIVVFLSDGYIGDDRSVIRTVHQRIGNARVYAFGIGDGVNRFLLDGMAAEGRGYSRFVETGENATEVAKNFAQSIKSPLLTDISIDWGDLAITEQTPAKIPDLFIGGTTRVFARYKQGGEYNVTINGLVNGKKAAMPISVTLADNVEQSPIDSKDSDRPTAERVDQNPIPLIWAREQIFQKNRDYTLSNEQDNQLKKQITQLGLDYSLQSRFTSFLAVSEKVVNKNAANNINAQVPLPQVSGVSSAAYPQLNLGGSSTPEPRGIIAFIMLAILAIIRFFRSAERRFTKTLVAETVAKMLAI